MLNFIIGRNNSGKTEKIRALIAERASENKKCILIVPEQFSFESERSILEKIGAQKMLNVDILSFTRLAFVINEQYGKALNKTIDDGTRKVLMSLSLEALSGKLEYFKRFSSKPALLSNLLTFVTELKQCAVTPDEIAEISGKTGNKSLGKKLSELSLIAASYDALVSRSFFDDENYRKPTFLTEKPSILMHFAALQSRNGTALKVFCRKPKMSLFLFAQTEIYLVRAFPFSKT